MFKKDKETIEMVEETFFKKHAKKIFVAGTVVSIAGLIYISKKYGIELNITKDKLEDVRNIGLRSLLRERANAEFEIAEKMEYINKLDASYNINTFVKIQEAEQKIAELQLFIKEINKDIKIIEGYPTWSV